MGLATEESWFKSQQDHEFSLLKGLKIGSGTHPASYSGGTRYFFLRGIVAGA
jgi:hypothetical protein